MSLEAKCFWDGGRREVRDGQEVRLLEEAPARYFAGGDTYAIYLREDIDAGSPEARLALERIADLARRMVE